MFDYIKSIGSFVSFKPYIEVKTLFKREINSKKHQFQTNLELNYILLKMILIHFLYVQMFLSFSWVLCDIEGSEKMSLQYKNLFLSDLEPCSQKLLKKCIETCAQYWWKM